MNGQFTLDVPVVVLGRCGLFDEEEETFFFLVFFSLGMGDDDKILGGLSPLILSES